MTTNTMRFKTVLADQFEQLFSLPEYRPAADKYTPQEMADTITDGLQAGTASNDGLGVKRTCKALGIKGTYKAINSYLSEG